MSDTAEIDAILAEDLRTMQRRLVAVAESVRRRRGRPETDVDDLFQDGVLGAFTTIKAEAERDFAAFRRLTNRARHEKMICIAAKVMDRRACDTLRRAYRRPVHTPIDDAPEFSDDSLLRACAAREDLDAIAAALCGSALQLYHLVLTHGRDDMAWLASQLGLSVSQTYRLMGDIKAVAHQVTGRAAAPRHIHQRSISQTAFAQANQPVMRRAC